MRPLRLLLLLFCFIALPVFLTCLSIFSARESQADSFSARYQTRSSRLRALFSFSAPFLLYPSAIISLTDDNSTFFLARPAAFGPTLRANGLDGQLWVGRGFGDDTLRKEGATSAVGWEFGCSDVPGWEHESKKHTETSGNIRPQKRSIVSPDSHPTQDRASDDEDNMSDEILNESTEDDGTDDYLHHPLPNSNPAELVKPGEPVDKSKRPTHSDIESLQESAEIAGKIVLLSRGGCGFLEKVKWAQRRGGIAVVVGDNERGAQLTTMYARGDTSNVSIPAVFTSFTSAHLLSSLVPAGLLVEDQPSQKSVGRENKNGKVQIDGPTFTSKSSIRPTNVPGDSHQQPMVQDDKGFLRNVLTSFGLEDDEADTGHEDSRRPPSSGNIDWVLVEDWDEEVPKQTPIKGQLLATSAKTVTSVATSTRSKSQTGRPTGDDFVIGVQDWRDADMVPPKAAETDSKTGKVLKQASTRSTSSRNAGETGAFIGGSITPGSGEYDHDGPEPHTSPRGGKGDQAKQHLQDIHAPRPEKKPGNWLRFWRSGVSNRADLVESSKDNDCDHKHLPGDHKMKSKLAGGKSPNKAPEHQGLWVTLTPTDVSTSPFFDTLLVLVVSPLVTLTIVYALLLLRSRIRRRRWRAPKSIVDRLPIRTYHTISTSSSTTSSQVATPDGTSPNSPLLRSTPRSISRTRPRSQTTTGVMTSTSLGSGTASPPVGTPTEKPKPKTPKRKRYTSTLSECVVCLEEYIDGESRVMRLPCGHEFHADCVIPWLTNRRRVCPICKLVCGNCSSPFPKSRCNHFPGPPLSLH
jgi:hypothetical protein